LGVRVALGGDVHIALAVEVKKMPDGPFKAVLLQAMADRTNPVMVRVRAADRVLEHGMPNCCMGKPLSFREIELRLLRPATATG
jgi:hypothetical protein